MLSIGKLVSGAENYYLNTVARAQEEYYTGAGEAPGYWVGGGSASLGLTGVVDASDLSAVLSGNRPGSDRPLGIGTSRAGRVAGFDLTFSAPKSVSIAYGLSSPETSRAVQSAHDTAVGDAVAYMERHAVLVRRGHNGEHRLETSGIVGAAFRHRTSRNGDPQLHTHVLVANAARGADGRWSSLHASLLYHHGRTAGFVYQAVLRAELVRILGVRFGLVRNGTAELDGVDAGLLRLFSTRHAEIEARLAERGCGSARSAQVAALETRRPKGQLPAGDAADGDAALRSGWRRRVVEAGLDMDLSIARPAKTQPVTIATEAESIRAALLSAKGLTEHHAAFERRDVVRGVAERLPDGARLSDIETLTDELLGRPEIVALDAKGRGEEQLHTTAEMLTLETELLELAGRYAGAGVGLASREAFGEALAARPTISDEQAEMVTRITSSGAGVEVVVGKAGAGKTFALDAARAAWQRSGLRVHGAALAARATAELSAGAGIPSTTLAALLGAYDRGELAFGSNDVLVVDEAGMVGTRDLHKVLRATVGVGAKVVLVGDPRQLPEIEAGGALSTLVARFGAIELAENRRQESAWERAALDELRHGEVAVAVQAFSDQGRVHFSPTSSDARAALVSAWAECRPSGVEARIYAPRRTDVEELNVRARAELRRRGELGEDLVRAGGRGFSLGDEVLCLRNDRRIKVLNGTRGVVTGSADDTVVIDTDAGRRCIPLEYVESGHLAHGYASTIHKAQGATVERAFVLGSEACYREAGYVAMSRARGGTDLYMVSGAFEDGLQRDKRRDPLDRLVDAFSSSRAKEMAISHLGAEELDGRRLSAVTRASERLTRSLVGRLPPDPAPYREALDQDRRRVTEWRGTKGAVVPAWVEAAEQRLSADSYRVVEMAEEQRQFTERYAPILGRLGELIHENDLGRRLLGEAAALDPPAYLTELLGPPPAFAVERPRWVAAAGTVESYRAVTGLEPSESGLGPRPEEGLQRAMYERTVAATSEYGRRREIVPLERRHGAELGR